MARHGEDPMMKAPRKTLLFYRRGAILYANARGQRKYMAGYSMNTRNGGVTFPWFPKWKILDWAERQDVDVRFNDDPPCAAGVSANA